MAVEIKDLQLKKLIKEAQAKALSTQKNQKVYLGDGLLLLITSKEQVYWRFKYRFNSKEKSLSFGVYPEITLKRAHKKLKEARDRLDNDIDPGEYKKQIKDTAKENLANSFEVIAREWFVKYKTTWSQTHASKILARLEKDIFPWLGDKPLCEVTPPMLLKVIQRIENRGAIETGHRALANCSKIFKYAIASGKAERDPAQDISNALAPTSKNHFPAITDPKRLGEILKVFDDYQGTFTVKCALKLAPLVFVRPGELRQAKWSAIDFNTAEWRYLVTKTKTEHIVPLAQQSLNILQDLRRYNYNSEFVFPSARSPKRPMSDNALLSALRTMGLSKDEITVHGFRATARTLIDEILEYPAHCIEHQLAHAVRDPNGRAYNRTAHLDKRKEMMQAWADYLDTIKIN